MKSRSIRQKGKSYEREIKDLIKEAYSLSDEDIRITIGQEAGADIKLSTKAKASFPFSLELKRRKSFDTIYKFYEQAKKHYPELIPAVVFRADFKNSMIMLDFDMFLTIITNKKEK